jgi:hypothetical protein
MNEILIDVVLRRKQNEGIIAEQHLLLKRDSAPWHKLFSFIKQKCVSCMAYYLVGPGLNTVMGIVTENSHCLFQS